MEIEKMYWNIGEVAKICNVATSTILHWEKEFAWLKPKMKKKGKKEKYFTRYYTEWDLELNCQVMVAICQIGMTHQGVKWAHKGKYLIKFIEIWFQIQGIDTDNLRVDGIKSIFGEN